MAPNVRKCRPQSDHVERSDLANRFFIAGWERESEPREQRERERALTLNVNGLNSPIKRHCLMKWIKKEDPTICCLQETHLTDRNKHRLKTKGWRRFTKPMAPENRQE
jgi:hypothetical protein